jgi:hypothetical protein
MKKFFALISISILVASPSFAAEEKARPGAPKNDKPAEQASPPPAAEEAKKTTDEPAPTIVVKNKSSFGVDPVTRSPFWPISWKPTGRVASAGGTDQGAVPPGAFLVSSITVDGATHFAIINGKTMSEGQQFGLQVGTQVYHVTVKHIEDGRVILGRQDEEIVVPLRRK